MANSMITAAKKVLDLFGKAIREYNLNEAGDRPAVAISGGKEDKGERSPLLASGYGMSLARFARAHNDLREQQFSFSLQLR